MTRVLRFISTVMIAAGLAIVILYMRLQDVDNLSILGQASFYVAKNYWFMFVAGILVLVFSIVGSFLSWFKKLDPVKEALPNAGYASATEIDTWVGGSTAAPSGETEMPPENTTKAAVVETELLPEFSSLSETELLTDGDKDKTELLQEVDET